MSLTDMQKRLKCLRKRITVKSPLLEATILYILKKALKKF